MDKNLIMKSLLKRETDRQFEIQKKKNEMKLIHPEHEQYHYFTDVFQDKLKQINTWLDASNSIQQKTELVHHFDKIWKELHLLQKFVADSLLFLRDYDIRICQKSLQDAETKTRKLEEELLPKKKFGFKNKKTTQTKKIDAIYSVDETDAKQKYYEKINEHFYGFKDEINAILNLENEQLFKRDVSLENLEKCLIKLNGTPSTLHMSNLRGCVILSGPVSTSVFAENCIDSKFAIACQQLRVHSSKNCDVYLHVTSKAIIEDSSGIKVAKYNYNYENLEGDYVKSTLDKSVNHWDEIEDFNWLVLDKQSPNWCLLKDQEKILKWDDFHM